MSKPKFMVVTATQMDGYAMWGDPDFYCRYASPSAKRWFVSRKQCQMDGTVVAYAATIAEAYHKLNESIWPGTAHAICRRDAGKAGWTVVHFEFHREQDPAMCEIDPAMCEVVARQWASQDAQLRAWSSPIAVLYRDTGWDYFVKGDLVALQDEDDVLEVHDLKHTLQGGN